MKGKDSRRQRRAEPELGDYVGSARAFRELGTRLQREIERVFRMKDGTPEKQRLMLALRTGLLAPQRRGETASSRAVFNMRMAGLTLAPDEPSLAATAERRLEREADDVAYHVAHAAESIAITIEALAGEFVKMDALNRLTAPKIGRAA